MQSQRDVSAPYTLRHLAQVGIRVPCKRKKRNSQGLVTSQNLKVSLMFGQHEYKFIAEDDLDLRLPDLFIRPPVVEWTPL